MSNDVRLRWFLYIVKSQSEAEKPSGVPAGPVLGTLWT